MDNIKETNTSWLKRHRDVLRPIGLGCLAVCGVVCAAVLLFLIHTWATAPKLDTDDIAPDGYRTTVLDANGAEMVTLVGEASNRNYVTLAKIPQDLQNAFIAIEDARH